MELTLDGELTRIESATPKKLEPYLSYTLSDYLKADFKYTDEWKIKVKIEWKDNTESFDMMTNKEAKST